MSKRKINQKDIAESLSLSVATVSKALRGDYSDINMETRARVVNMASQMGYMHGTHHQQAIAEETASLWVGVLILRKLHEWQHTAYFAGMSEKCAKLNVSLVLHYVGEDACGEILNPAHQPPAMRKGELSGLILVNRWPEEIVAELAAKHPCVSVQHTYKTPLDWVGVDEAHGIDALCDHLYGLGHRRIGFFGHCPQVDIARSRFAAYVSAMYRLGLPFEPTYSIGLAAAHLEDKEMNLTGHLEPALKQIQNGVRAWVCANDWVGYLLCRNLMDRGYQIPKDVSIVGFDNSEDNTLGCPRLTSVSIAAQKVGAEALRRLIGRVRHPSSPLLRVMLPCKLFEAQTTAHPPRP